MEQDLYDFPQILAHFLKYTMAARVHYSRFGRKQAVHASKDIMTPSSICEA
jgi:hypothetical protein